MSNGTERLVWNSFAGCAPTVLYHEWHPANPIQICTAQYSDPLHLWLLIPAKINGRTNGYRPMRRLRRLLSGLATLTAPLLSADSAFRSILGLVLDGGQAKPSMGHSSQNQRPVGSA